MCKHCEEERLRHHGKIGINEGTVVTAWVSCETVQEIDKIAYNNGWSRSATIAAIIEKYIGEKEEF